MIWLAASSYTRDVEVMALNNLGSAETHLGDFEAARSHLARAIELDPRSPLPYFNMGQLTLRVGRTADAMPWFDKARAFGMRGDRSDQRALNSAQNNASLSTTGMPFTELASTPAQGPSLAGFVVYLLDDDVAPFEFAVSTVEEVFGLTGLEAIRVVQAADRAGRAACAGFETREQAEQKVQAVAALAREHGYPLACEIAAAPWS